MGTRRSRFGAWAESRLAEARAEPPPGGGAAAGASAAARAAGSTAPGAGRCPEVRCLLVGCTPLFVWDSWLEERSLEKGHRVHVDRSKTATGALFAGWAIVRHCASVADCTLVAVAGRDKKEVLRPPRWETFEGRPVYVGTPAEVEEHLRTVVAEHGPFDVAVCPDSLEDVVELAAFRVEAKRLLAFAHTYQELPFGPFGSLQVSDSRIQALGKMELLCPSEALAAYARRWGAEAGRRARACWLADVHYFGGPFGEPVAAAHDLDDGAHEYVLMVSPCPAKGLAILLPLAQRVKDLGLKFAVIATSWTTKDIQKYLSFYGIKVFLANGKVEKVYRQTRILLAPSLWPEVYGLVVMEAALRGVPCISSRSCGLREANPVEELTVETPLFFDVATQSFVEGLTAEEFEGTPREEVSFKRPLSGAKPEEQEFLDKLASSLAQALEVSPEQARLIMHTARNEVVEPYAVLLRRLSQDPEFFRWASEKARARALQHVVERRDAFVELLRAGPEL